MAKWLKLDTGIFGDEKIALIRALPEGDSLFALWVGILCIGMRRESDLLYIAEGVPYDTKAISKVLSIDEMVVAIGVETFTGLGMLSVLDDGVIRITNFGTHQALDRLSETRGLNAERQRRHRAKSSHNALRNALVTPDVTLRNATDLDLDLDLDLDKDKGRKDAAYSAAFDTLWSCYPRKTNKKGAHKAYTARRREGVEHDELVRAVAGYSEAVKAERTDQVYVMHGATFLGPNDRWKEYVNFKAEVLIGQARTWECLGCGKVQEHTGAYCLGCGADR